MLCCVSDTSEKSLSGKVSNSGVQFICILESQVVECSMIVLMIVLIDHFSNLDEHLYLLLGIPKLQKLGQERLRLPI